MRRFIIGFDLHLERDYPSLWLIEWTPDRLDLCSLVCLPPGSDFFLQLRVLDDMITGLPPDSCAVLLTDESGYSDYAARDAQYRHPEILVEHVAVSRCFTLAEYRSPPPPRTRAERLATMRKGLEHGVVRMANSFQWTVFSWSAAGSDLS